MAMAMRLLRALSGLLRRADSEMAMCGVCVWLLKTG